MATCSLFLTWLPNYLVQELQISVVKSAGYAAIPWLYGTIAELVVGGWLVDWLIRRGGNEVRCEEDGAGVRTLIGMSVVGAVFARDPVLGDLLDFAFAERPVHRGAGLLDPAGADRTDRCRGYADRDHQLLHRYVASRRR